MISISNLSYAYSRTEVLSDVSLHFGMGDFCAVMGPNGSGKSTLLKILSRLITAQKGIIKIDGKSIEQYGVRELATKISYVPQRQETAFDFTVFETVMMGRNPYQNHWEKESKKDMDIVMQMLERTHLLPLKDRMLSQLSGGEMQRTLIARAMAQQAPIMLLDEPLSNLDIAHKFEIMDILSVLNRTQNITLLIVLHDFPMALQYTGQTLFLKAGNVVRHGDTQEIVTPENIKATFDLSDNYYIDNNGMVNRKQL